MDICVAPWQEKSLVLWYFSFDWHSRESPFVSKLQKAESAQHGPQRRGHESGYAPHALRAVRHFSLPYVLVM